MRKHIGIACAVGFIVAFVAYRAYKAHQAAGVIVEIPTGGNTLPGSPYYGPDVNPQTGETTRPPAQSPGSGSYNANDTRPLWQRFADPLRLFS